ncbi:hypothetical protein KSC_034870 [Ktedonobacter sp. SOSP1-52]|nr:hypothetical protein [Ktedonobacter sp. SOSP1-52]GHO64595.1 hypothetical protein KSC_034870 [Ktedonobacter sp. SOSP1-52]
MPQAVTGGEREIDPAQEMELADSVGLALLVVLDMLAPAERIAFVLHDIFAVPFDEIAPPPMVACQVLRHGAFILQTL